MNELRGITTGVRSGPQAASEALDRSLSPDEARRFLHHLQTELRRPDGTARSGVLALMRAGASRDEIGFERRSTFQLNARRRSEPADTAAALQAIFRKAGLPEAARREFEIYLRGNANRTQAGGLLGLLDRYLKPDEAV